MLLKLIEIAIGVPNQTKNGEKTVKYQVHFQLANQSSLVSTKLSCSLNSSVDASIVTKCFQTVVVQTKNSPPALK